MILLTRFNGPVFALNPDLIERADHTPDTVITLVDGTKYVIAESLSELMLIMRRHRAGVLADAELLINGHFREVGWPPPGQPFPQQDVEQPRATVLEPVRQLHPDGPGREQAAGAGAEPAAGLAAGPAEPGGQRPADQVQQIHPAGRRSSAASPTTVPETVPESPSDVIPLHRRGQ